MAYPSGLSGQLGFKAETTYGQRVTVDRFVPFIDEGIESTPDMLESGGIIAGVDILGSNQWANGVWRHEGPINLEVYDRTIGLWLHHALGSVTTSGTTAPYTHTITPGDMTGLGMTVQVGRPDRGGTVRPFTYAGVKVQSWELAVETNEFATLGLEVVAQTVTTGVAVATAAISQSIAPMSFVNGSFSLAGSSLCVRSARIGGENSLNTDRVCIGQDYIDEPVQDDLRVISGQVELEFPDLVHWERFRAGTEGALVLGLQRGTSTLTVTANVRTDALPTTVSGRGMVVQTLDFTAVRSSTQNSSAIQVVYLSPDATP